MLTDFLITQASVHASGAMTRQEREEFELLLEFNPELRALATGLSAATSALMLAAQRPAGAPPASLRSRIMGQIASHPQQTTPEGLVMSGPDGLVQWINPAFSEMCGYTLEELRGCKLGPILQGAETDRATAERMRAAVHQFQPCTETILNYHKNGSAYWVQVAITPIPGADGRPKWLVARERELKHRIAA